MNGIASYSWPNGRNATLIVSTASQPTSCPTVTSSPRCSRILAAVSAMGNWGAAPYESSTLRQMVCTSAVTANVGKDAVGGTVELVTAASETAPVDVVSGSGPPEAHPPSRTMISHGVSREFPANRLPHAAFVMLAPPAGCSAGSCPPPVLLRRSPASLDESPRHEGDLRQRRSAQTRVV